MYTPHWVTPDGYRLTIADLKDITSRAITVITLSDEYAAEEHSELIAELRAIGSLCDDARMTAGELTLPAK